MFSMVMKWIKVIVIGILATFSMDIAMNAAMIVLNVAPTNIHPAAAFLYNLGIEHSLLATLLHYSYGTLWAIVFVYTFENEVSVKRGLQLAGVLWLFRWSFTVQSSVGDSLAPGTQNFFHWGVLFTSSPQPDTCF